MFKLHCISFVVISPSVVLSHQETLMIKLVSPQSRDFLFSGCLYHLIMS